MGARMNLAPDLKNLIRINSGGNGAYRAGISACSAVDACIRIDNIFAVSS
jgi:hypothetical protein